MPAQKTSRTLARLGWGAALVALGIAAAASVRRHAGAPGRSTAEEGGGASSAWPHARLAALDAETLQNLCRIYYQCRQFHFESLPGSGPVRDAQLFFGTLPYPVAVVRCAAPSTGAVDLDVVRDLAEAMSRCGIPKGIVHAPGEYTREAARYARANRIRLVSGRDLARSISRMPEEARAVLAAALHEPSRAAEGPAGALVR